MFNFMKKGDEKEKRKKEKDSKKKRDNVAGSSDETPRFDDVRRSLKISRKRKEKLPSGITADYTGNLFAEMNREEDVNRSGSLPGYASRSDSSEASLNSLPQVPAKVFPPLPPRPPKRGILKGVKPNTNNEIYDPQEMSNPMLLEKNTLQNEVIAYQQMTTSNHEKSNSNSLFLSTNEKPHLLSVASSAESLTDTTNSSFATPPLLSPTEHPPPPPITALVLPTPRLLTIYRTARGDFGFQLRRALVTDKLNGTGKKEVLFAEPGSLGGHISDTGLLPGDVLLEVNGNPVQDVAREQIIGMIKNSGTTVDVKVQPITELSEVTRRCRQVENVEDSKPAVPTLKTSASLRFRSTKGRSEEELAKEKEWLDADRLWLVHRSGFSAARPIKSSSPQDSGKVKIKLENSDEVLEVQEDDLERANPPKFDAIENLCELRYINESSILHTLRQRFGNNLIHTYAASSLIVINPECPLSIYNEKVANLFFGCDEDDMPPHIYASAQAAYRAMVHTRRDQSIVLLGRSGSGKTHNFRHLLSYLIMASGMSNKTVSMEKLTALHVVLEAFGNARTLQNANATRCTNLMSLDFDQSRQIASASIQIIMLEKERVVRRLSGESSFHVFYYLLAGAQGSLSKQLFLDVAFSGENSFVTPVSKNDERQRCQIEFSKLCLSLTALGTTERECNVIWSVIAVIYHLGYAGVVQVGTAKWQFSDPISASRAARLLGTTPEELAAAVWDLPLSPSRSGTSSPNHRDSAVQGVEALHGFVQGLYNELVNVINAIINRSLSSNVNTTASIVLLDTPGFQSPGGPGTFYDLCHNYVQERLHLLYHNTVLLAPLDRFTQERIDVNIEELYTEQVSPAELVNVLDKPPPGGVLKTSQTDLSDVDRRGLLWLTEEETVYPNSSDDTLLQHILQQYGTKDYIPYIKRWSGTGQLCIQHLQGTNPIVYNVRGWLRSCREPKTARAALTLLQESSREEVSELFVVGRGGGGMFSPEGASQSLRRVSSIRRTCSAAVKRKSIGLQIKHTTDSIIETLRRTRTRFVFCLSPQQWSGLGDGIPSTATPALVNIPLLRTQIRAVEIVPAVRLYKQGFPEHMPHSEFVRRFRLLAGGDATPLNSIESVNSNRLTEPSNAPARVTITVSGPTGATSADEGRLVAEILYRAEIDEAGYRIGLSEVFFRAGIIPQLETQRDEKLSGVIVGFQSYCRGFIARKHLVKLRVQDTAVRCIQRNVRKLMQVREWSWWRLYVKICPLLNVRSHEEELIAKIREIETIRTKLEKLEIDNASLRLDKDKLESKLNEMTADLTEERLNGAHAAERLDAETSERIRIEQELSQVSSQKSNLEQATERMELELHYAKNYDNTLSDGDDLIEGRDENDVYKRKCARLKRENEMLKQQLRQQHEDDLEQLVGLKKQLEKRLADANEEIDEQRQVAAEWKRKSQKLQAELNDFRIIVEEQNSRNSMLEKKQRKFDAEIQMLQDEIRSEKNAKDRLARDRDVAVSSKCTMEQTLASIRIELELKEEEVRRLTRELDEMSFGGATEQDIAQLKKAKHDLEKKIKEQDDELDDQAGQVSLLESAKLKLEMSLENIRKEHRREIAQKEEEIEEARSNAIKKLKGLEATLEQEYEERSQLLRGKHELERRLKDIEDQGRSTRAADEDALVRLRKDLRKTKALLRDAQAMLDRAKEDSHSKTTLRALKNQLEDSELAKESALKAKQKLTLELNDVSGQLEDAQRLKSDAECKAQAASRNVSTLMTQLEENEEELSELMKKYNQHLSTEEMRASEAASALADVESERNSLREQLAEATARLESMTVPDPAPDANQRRLEITIQDLKTRLDLDGAVRKRLEVQISRLKEKIDRLTEESNQHQAKELSTSDQMRKLQVSLRESKEQISIHVAREQDLNSKKRDLEKRLEVAELTASAARAEVKLSDQRVQDLQAALTAEISESEGTSDVESG